MAHRVVDNGDRTRGFIVMANPDLTFGDMASEVKDQANTIHGSGVITTADICLEASGVQYCLLPDLLVSEMPQTQGDIFVVTFTEAQSAAAAAAAAAADVVVLPSPAVHPAAAAAYGYAELEEERSVRKSNRAKGIPLLCFKCRSLNLGNWKRLHNPNAQVPVGGAAARAVDRNVTPSSVCVCKREACLQPFLDLGYNVVDTRDGPQGAPPTSSEEFVMIHILSIAKEEKGGPRYDVLVEWDGYDKNDHSTWETLSAMLEEDAELVKRELRELNLSEGVAKELHGQHGIEL